MVSFDENREVASGFDIINWVTFPNQSFSRVNVGRMDAQPLQAGEFTIEEAAITWHSIFNKVGQIDYGFLCTAPNWNTFEHWPLIILIFC